MSGRAVLNVDGTGSARLTDNEVFDGSVRSWSPDGDRVVFESDRNGDFDLWGVNSDGTEEQRLLDAPATEDRRGRWGPARRSR